MATTGVAMCAMSVTRRTTARHLDCVGAWLSRHQKSVLDVGQIRPSCCHCWSGRCVMAWPLRVPLTVLQAELPRGAVVQEGVVFRGMSYVAGALAIMALVLGLLVVADRLDPTSEMVIKTREQDENSKRAGVPASDVEKVDQLSSFARYRQMGAALHDRPASLQGTDVDGELLVDAQGNLVASIGVRRVFDYFLSTLGEEDLDTIKARIAAHLVEKLPPEAARQAWRLLNNYLDCQHALSELPLQSRDAKGVRAAMKQRQQLRQV